MLRDAIKVALAERIPGWLERVPPLGRLQAEWLMLDPCNMGHPANEVARCERCGFDRAARFAAGDELPRLFSEVLASRYDQDTLAAMEVDATEMMSSGSEASDAWDEIGWAIRSARTLATDREWAAAR